MADKKPKSRSGRVPKRVEGAFARACLWDLQLQVFDAIHHAVRHALRGVQTQEAATAWAVARMSVVNARAWAWQEVALVAFEPDALRAGGTLTYRKRYADLIRTVAGERWQTLSAAADPRAFLDAAAAELGEALDDGEDA